MKLSTRNPRYMAWVIAETRAATVYLSVFSCGIDDCCSHQTSLISAHHPLGESWTDTIHESKSMPGLGNKDFYFYINLTGPVNTISMLKHVGGQRKFSSSSPIGSLCFSFPHS